MTKKITCFTAMLLFACTGFSQVKKTTVPVTATQVTVKSKTEAPSPVPHTGRYELYSGVPTLYIGHVIMLDNGKYKVAFDTDENNYDETGTYRYHADTQTIEWISGMFFNNNWKGKFVSKDGGYRIEFNKSSYAESK